VEDVIEIHIVGKKLRFFYFDCLWGLLVIGVIVPIISCILYLIFSYGGGTSCEKNCVQ
jgi:hypothetical protein